MTTPLTDTADRIVTAHATALAPLMRIAAAPITTPPRIEDGLAAGLHLRAHRSTLDAATTELLRALIAEGNKPAKLARLLGVRPRTLVLRLTSPAPAAPTAPELHPGMFKPRDRTSVRAARESLITAAGDLGREYADALRPLSNLTDGTVPPAAVPDVALQAALHLHASRTSLDSALDPILAALVLGGVRRTQLAPAIGVSGPTLQRRLMAHPLAHARGVDLVDQGGGRWAVVPAEIGRYAESGANARAREGASTGFTSADLPANRRPSVSDDRHH